MSGIDEGDVLISQQQSAIKRVKKLLEGLNLPKITDAEIMGALEKTKNDSGANDHDNPYGKYDPETAYNVLRNKLITSKTRNKIVEAQIADKQNADKQIEKESSTKTRKKLDDAKNAAKKIGDSNNKTRKNRIRTEIIKAQEYNGEKQDLELKLPGYLNHAKVDIIERDDHCFFRSITHQLRDYGFTVTVEYQTVRNLIADYIDENIPLDIVNGIGYATVKYYTDAIRGNLWGGALEIQAVLDGCLNSLTGDQTLKIIIYFVNNKNEIALEPDFFNTIPKDEDWRWPIRLLYVGDTVDYNGNNHFHRIYFEDLDRQKQHYVEENVRPEIAQSPNLMLSPRIKMSPSEMEAQIQAYTQFNKGRKIVEINENSGEYLDLLFDNLSKPFMVMGYQNGEPNIFYESIYWHYRTQSYEQRYICHIYIPRDIDKNNRQYTRYPNPTMLDVDGKTIVNISLHRWANIWDDNKNIPLGNNTHEDSAEKNLLIYMTETNGVDEVLGDENAEFTSISEKEKSVPYMRHGNRGMAFSPDTGVIALDDSVDNPNCIINITDPTDERKLQIFIDIYRTYDGYKKRITYGGKSRRRRNTRKLRRNKRRQTKRRPAKRAFKLTQ